jgi:hypothetical protein
VSALFAAMAYSTFFARVLSMDFTDLFISCRFWDWRCRLSPDFFLFDFWIAGATAPLLRNGETGLVFTIAHR